MPGGVINTPERFAAELDVLRRASGRSYRALADECGLGFTTIAGYCAGRHLPQPSVRGEFSRLLAALGVTVERQDVWFAALAALRARARGEEAAAPNPFKGLRAFEFEDAPVFFGRAELVSKVLDDLALRAGEGPLIVVGPSGSGKSSLLRAGLLPALASWVLMTPTATPLREWTLRLRGAPDGAVVVVDQFEELFTTCSDEGERQGFLQAVLDHTAPVVLGLRADFYDQALRYPQLTGPLQSAQVVVEPMTEAALREVIVEPARTAGLRLEGGLVELLLRDTVREPAALPMLSHTLHTIVELARRDDPAATFVGLEHYRAAGGVHGAVAQSADITYGSLTDAQQLLAGQLFRRLVQTDVRPAVARRQVTFDELFDGRPAMYADDLAEVVDAFVSRRLLTAGTRTLEIGHEALLTAWPRMQEWLADDRVGQHVLRRLTAAARAWRDDGRAADGLYHGGMLGSALSWAEQGAADLNPLEREFLAASVHARDARLVVERRRVRRRRQLVGAVLVLVLAAAGSAVYAWGVTVAAQRAARSALSREIAARAVRVRDADPALAAQLAVTAYTTAATPEARAALLDSSARPLPFRIRAQGSITAVAEDATLLATGTDGGLIQLARTSAGGPPVRVGTQLRFGRSVAALALGINGGLLAAGDDTGRVAAWQVTDPGRPHALLPQDAGSGRVFGLAFSPDGRWLAAGTTRAVVLWRLGGGTAPRAILIGSKKAVRSVAFTSDGRTLAAGGDDGTVRLWDVSAPSHVGPLATLTGPTSEIYSIAVSADGHTLAAATAREHVVYTWDITTRAHPARIGARLAGPGSWINTVAFSPDGTTLAAGSSDTLLWQWDLRTRQPVGTLPHPAPVTAALYRDKHTLYTLATDGIIRVWPLPGPALAGSTNQVFSASFDSSGTRLLVGAGDNSLRLWDLTDPARAVRASPSVRNSPYLAPLDGAAALSPDRSFALAGSSDGHLHLWDLTDPARPTRIGDPLPVATATIQAVTFASDGMTAAVSSDDGSVHLVDVSDPHHPSVLAGLRIPAAAFGVRFSPDGHLLAVAGGDSVGYLYDITDHAHPRRVGAVSGFGGPVYAAAFRHDGRILAFAGADYTTRLVDVADPDHMRSVGRPLTGPVGEVYELAFSPQGDTLAVASIDGSIWLWNLHTPRRPDLLATLTADGGLFTIAFSPDGHTLAAGGRDQAVRLWDTDPASATARICAGVGAPITRSEWAQFVPDEPYSPPCR